MAIFTVFVKICWPCSICWTWLAMDRSSCSICITAWPDCVGIEHDARTELGIRDRLQCRRKPNGEHGKGSFLHLSRPFVAVGFVTLYSGTALLLCSENLFLELRKTVGLWLAPCFSFFLLGF